MNNSNQPRRFYNPFYIIFDAFRNIWRHRVTGIASVLVLSSCLILLGAFGLLIRNIDVNMEKLGLLNEIVVFADYDVTPEQLQIITEDIKALPNVTYVDFISKDAGFESMKETYPDYAELFDSIAESGDNPLADSFVVTYKDTAGANKLEYDLLQINGVMKVNNRVDYAAAVENFKSGASFVFLWFIILLLAVSNQCRQVEFRNHGQHITALRVVPTFIQYNELNTIFAGEVYIIFIGIHIDAGLEGYTFQVPVVPPVPGHLTGLDP
jgi:cell division transport system permease protein